jgi:hypothetical protein
MLSDAQQLIESPSLAWQKPEIDGSTELDEVGRGSTPSYPREAARNFLFASHEIQSSFSVSSQLFVDVGRSLATQLESPTTRDSATNTHSTARDRTPVVVDRLVCCDRVPVADSSGHKQYDPHTPVRHW